jgi:excisionase family DNA binding protein
MTAEEVAASLRLGLSTVYGLARSGDLASLLIGSAVRFDPQDVEAYKAKCRRISTKPASAGATSLTDLLTDGDSALASYFRAAGPKRKPKPTRASKTQSCTPLRLVQAKANP